MPTPTSDKAPVSEGIEYIHEVCPASFLENVPNVDPDELAECLVVPAQRTAADACHICLGPLLGAFGTCENCAEHQAILGISPTPIVPISLYHRDTVLRQWVTGYKTDLTATHLPSAIDETSCRLALRAILDRFFAVNSWLSIDIDQVVIVPSTIRQPPHPLEELLVGSPVREALAAGLLKRTMAPLGSRTPNLAAYMTDADVAGHRILLIDDVYASGARLQSAAATLREAGATVARGVVIARRVNLHYDPGVKEMWMRQAEERFSWKREPVILRS